MSPEVCLIKESSIKVTSSFTMVVQIPPIMTTLSPLNSLILIPKTVLTQTNQLKSHQLYRKKTRIPAKERKIKLLFRMSTGSIASYRNNRHYMSRIQNSVPLFQISSRSKRNPLILTLRKLSQSLTTRSKMIKNKLKIQILVCNSSRHGNPQVEYNLKKSEGNSTNN